MKKNFTLDFKAFFGDDSNGADGIVFVIQPLSVHEIGGTGGHFLAYGNNPSNGGNDGIATSLAVEFDTWPYPKDGPGGDPNRNEIEEDHIAIIQDGDILVPIDGPVAADGTNPISDGEWHDISIQYCVDRTTLEVFFEGSSKLAKDVGSLDYFGDSVFWGFTGATGIAFNRQMVRLTKGLQYGLPGDKEYARYELDDTLKQL